MVSPILLYSSDFCGFFKEILGVGKQTTNIGVLLELGRYPLHINAIKLSVKNWERIKKGNANNLLLASYFGFESPVGGRD